MKRISTLILLSACALMSCSVVMAQKYESTGSGDFGGGLEPGAKDKWAPGFAPGFWNKQNTPPVAEPENPLSSLNAHELEIAPETFNQGFAQKRTGQQDYHPFGGPARNAYGGPTITKGASEVDLSIMGSGFNTGFKIEKPSEYTEIMKRSGMPSTFNEQGGVDDPLIGF